ncbi:MAG: response regulator [Lautropia sp.]
MRILIVEDDELIGEGLASGLAALAFTVDWFRDGTQADAALASVAYDCIVLDLGLPVRDGLWWLERWREAGRATPVIVLTAREALESRIGGLDRGADDYLVKPIAVRELAARIRAVARRAGGRAESVWRHGALEFDSAARTVRWRGIPVELTSRELSLLEVFMRHPSRVLSRTQIIEQLYGWDDSLESNALEVFVHHLRRKIDPGIVRTLRGVGYALGEPRE